MGGCQKVSFKISKSRKERGSLSLQVSRLVHFCTGNCFFSYICSQPLFLMDYPGKFVCFEIRVFHPIFDLMCNTE